MKLKQIVTPTAFFGLLAVTSCNESFLEQQPLGAISEASVQNLTGAEGVLINAYATLRGTGGWYTSPINWVWGGVRSDDAYKGTEAADQNVLNPIERFESLPSLGPINDKWQGCYDGVAQANLAIRTARSATGLTDAQKLGIEAQARFIRGFHHLEAKMSYNRIPFVDETITQGEQFSALRNDADVWPRIEADLKFAYDNLPETQAQIGRVNKWAAGAYLAKAFMFQRKFTDARPLLQTIIQQGRTSGGTRYALMDRYGDVFRGVNESGAEIIFGIQFTVGDGNAGANGNQDGVLYNPHNNGPGGCCGFYQPSQNLVNAYKTSATGLPLFDTFNDSDVNNFEANPNNPNYTGPLDPRLDWSVGRIGVPFLDWGPAQTSWIRNIANGGPYLPKKHIHYRAEIGTYQTAGTWGQSISGKNWPLMRYPDVLLMKAECDVEANDLESARTIVNQIRQRAANPEGFVRNADGTPAANYVINLYTAPWTDQNVARTAVRFERRLELAMEGHRFFELVRWGNVAPVMNAYLTVEQRKRTHLAGARFVPNKDEYLPIPEQQIILSTINGTPNIAQNPGY